MSEIFGALNLPDTSLDLVNQIGQSTVYDAINRVLQMHQEEVDRAMSFFVERTTTDFKRTFKLAGGGYLDKRGRHAPSGAAKGFGEWGVALPLESWGRQIAGDRVTLAYMTLQELNVHLDTIQVQNLNTIRREILKALFSNEVYEFSDERYDILSVQPLANGDTVLYPPIDGDADADVDDHYLVSGYAANAIDDTNNPFGVIRNEIEEHMGGTEDVIIFINPAETALTQDLGAFQDQDDPRLNDPAAIELIGLPQNTPGRVIGRVDRAWVAEWKQIPAGYMFGLVPSWVKPLEKRIHPPETGLPATFQLVAEHEIYPLRESHYENNFGFGVTNRLNGVVMQLTADVTYTSPANLARVPAP